MEIRKVGGRRVEPVQPVEKTPGAPEKGKLPDAMPAKKRRRKPPETPPEKKPPQEGGLDTYA